MVIRVLSMGMLVVLAVVIFTQIIIPAFCGGRFFPFFTREQKQLRNLTDDIDSAHDLNRAKDLKQELDEVEKYEPEKKEKPSIKMNMKKD